jgi:hypothetical protein
MNKKRMLATTILLVSLMLLAVASPSLDSYEAYYLYLGNYPSDANPGWHENVQGLTHDRDNWFITQTGRLWKIPVECDLGSVSRGDRGVLVKRLWDYEPQTNPHIPPRIVTDIPELWTAGYNHLGDPGYYEFDGRGYIVVPIEESKNEPGGKAPFAPPAIAVFRADTLEFANYACLTGQTSAGWCAVDPQSRVYSSSGNLGTLHRYAVDWNTLLSSKTPLTLPNPTRIDLADESGFPVEIRSMQGGEISPSGQLLYLVAGYFGDLDSSWGIHVFDLSTQRRVQRSTNGSGHFNYEFHPTCSFPTYNCEEPEGITIWDLDDGRAPGIRGQLHVLLLRNEYFSDDDVYLKHYTGTIYVDRTYNGVGNGTPSKPFKTVSEANNLAWDGAQIKIQSRPQTGSYPETLTFSKRVKVLAQGGTATVGR